MEDLQGRIESQNEPLQSQSNQGTSFILACFNGLNALSGVGILSVPFALSAGGWLSLILFFLVALLCWYTGLLLKLCMDADPLIRSYPDISSLAFGLKGRAIVSIFLCLELYLVAVEFLILEGDNLDKLFPNMDFSIGSIKIRGKPGFVMLTALIILPTTWLRSLGLLAYLSAGGVVASALVVCCIFWVGAIDGVGFHERGKLLNWGGIPTAVSMFSFCYCTHPVLPTLYNSMSDRSQFSKVLLVCFIVSTINYGSMAVLGYLMFGESLNSQVTLNLPLRKISTQIAIYTTLINPLTKYTITTTPIFIAIEETLCTQNKKCFISILVRTVIVISTVIVALSLPYFSYVMEFIGAFLSVTMSMLLPCLCYLRINQAAQGFGLELILIVGILLVGLCICVVGTYTSLKQIVNHL